ncbi:MAG TPA: hypothetical protein VM659_26570 [Dongiaceae bacterium]|nr:hypothetical protein [Dongiaceae bacterium]
MRDFRQTLPVAPQAASPVDTQIAELAYVEMGAGQHHRTLPAGLLARSVLVGAVLATMAEAEPAAGSAADDDDAWLDRALEGSFPASDPIASNRYN